MNQLTTITILFLLAFSSCYRKVIDPYFGVYFSKIESEVMKLERVSSTDTGALLSGTIYRRDVKDTIDTKTLTDAVVTLMDQETGKMYGNLTDANGKYQIYLPPSVYVINVQYFQYTSLVIRDVMFRKGDIMELNALLGLSLELNDSTVYVMQADKPIKREK